MIKGQEPLFEELTRIFRIFKNTEGDIKPHFILTGASGTGKTMTIQTLAETFELGFIEINAAQLTKEGTSGNSLSKALSPLLQFSNRLTICFVDEFDKLFLAGGSNSEIAHETTTGVQNEFLKVLESNTTSVFGDYGKYVSVSTNKILFVFAGAFNGEQNISIERLQEIGVKTEFLGRVGLVYNTSPLTLDVLFSIIDENLLLKKYLKLFSEQDEEQVKCILKAKVKEKFETNTLGARMINTLIHKYFIKGGFESIVKEKEYTPL